MSRQLIGSYEPNIIIENWESEHEEILALVKKQLKNAPYILQDTIKVEKLFGSFYSGRDLKFWPFTYNPTVSSNPWKCFVGLEQKISFLGYYYQITFGVQTTTGINVRRVNVVTKAQYLERLKAIGLDELYKQFSEYNDVGLFYHNTQHCEEGLGLYYPTPVIVPISLEVWSTTKLLQRLGYEGCSVNLNGILTLVSNEGRSVLMEKVNSKINNQAVVSNSLRATL